MSTAAPQTHGLADFLEIVDLALGPIARRLPAHVGREDLASAGKLALVLAFDRCVGPAEEVRAYCYVRVRGAILDELRRLDPLTRRERALAHTAGTVTGSPRRPRAVATEEIEWNEIADESTSSPAETVEVTDLRASLHSALERLPRNQAHAVRRYHLEEATLDEIAHELGVSRERARQIREAGEKKLRNDLVVLALWNTLAAERD
jgi:RNA polymerase sigma factor FliA